MVVDKSHQVVVGRRPVVVAHTAPVERIGADPSVVVVDIVEADLESGIGVVVGNIVEAVGRIAVEVVEHIAAVEVVEVEEKFDQFAWREKRKKEEEEKGRRKLERKEGEGRKSKDERGKID